MIPLLAALAAGPVTDTAITYMVGGVRVIQQVDTGTRLAAAGIYFLGGTAMLTPTTAGVEDLLIHAAARGSRRYPLDGGTRALARTGAIETIDVEEDWTALWLEGFASDFDSSWAVMADQVVAPMLSDSLVNRARMDLLAAAQARYDDPEQRIRALAESVMFAGHPYAMDPRGNPTSLAALTPDAVRQFQHREMVGSRMLLVVVGNVSRERLTALVTATLGTVPAGNYHWIMPLPLPYREAARGSRWVVENRPLPTTYILGYCTGPQPGDPSYWPFRIANRLYSGLVFDAVRGRGLSYAAGAAFLDRAMPVGGFEMSTPAPDQAFPLALAALEELTNLNVSSIQDDESSARWFFFTRQVRREFLAELRQAQSTVLGTVDVLARAQLFFGDYRQVSQLLPSTSAFDGQHLSNAASACRTRMEYAFLGDSTRMNGKW